MLHIYFSVVRGPMMVMVEKQTVIVKKPTTASLTMCFIAIATCFGSLTGGQW